MEQKFILGLSPVGFHKIAYTQFGRKEETRTIICVHGLIGNGRSFDFLAEHLSSQARVICPDMVGRGKSSWFTNPKYYDHPQYLADLTALIARLDVNNITWIGTSMGGILGMYLAAQPNTPIKDLILNDVGPFIPRTGLQLIANYTKKHNELIFADLCEAESYIRKIYKDFGNLSNAQWQHLTQHNVIQQENNLFKLAYDPQITSKLHNIKIKNINLWSLWERIQCQVLVLRGEKSNILPKKITEKMSTTGPKATIIEIPDCGHAPMLMSPQQISIVSDWVYR